MYHRKLNLLGFCLLYVFNYYSKDESKETEKRAHTFFHVKIQYEC